MRQDLDMIRRGGGKGRRGQRIGGIEVGEVGKGRLSVEDDGDGVEGEVEVSLTREMLSEEAETSMSISRSFLPYRSTASALLLSLIKIVLSIGCTRRT
jgi:hypothetical protein